MDIETFTLTLYTCGCGYKTTRGGNSNRHKKVTCGHEIVSESREFVLKTDHLTAMNGGKVTTTITDNSITDNSTNSTVNINLVLPDRTTKEDFIEYLETLGDLGFRTPEQIATIPGKMLMFTRGATKLPGALVERNKKIIEKLPDGSERVMAKKKAIQTYTHEAVDALCLRPPAKGVVDFLETERGFKRTKVSLQDAAKLRVSDPKSYHNTVPGDVKFRHQKIESHTEKCLDHITAENKTNGFW